MILHGSIASSEVSLSENTPQQRISQVDNRVCEGF